MADDIFEQYGVYRWVIGGFDIALPIAKWTHTLAKRVAPHERLYRPGARHDDLGPKAEVWEATFLGHNGSDEPGIPTDYYPEKINQLEDSLSVEGVGTLYTLRGPRRCIFATMTRAEDRKDGVDAASVVATWYEDNEDDANAAAFLAPSARSIADSQIALADVSLAAAGIGGGDFIDSLKAAVAQIVALADFPGDQVAAMQAQARIVFDSVDQIESAYASATFSLLDQPEALLTDPVAEGSGRILRRLSDTIARAPFEQSSASSTKTTTKRYNVPLSIFAVATDVDQDAFDLLQLNAGLLNPYAIPAGTPVLVFA